MTSLISIAIVKYGTKQGTRGLRIYRTIDINYSKQIVKLNYLHTVTFHKI